MQTPPMGGVGPTRARPGAKKSSISATGAVLHPANSNNSSGAARLMATPRSGETVGNRAGYTISPPARQEQNPRRSGSRLAQSARVGEHLPGRVQQAFEDQHELGVALQVRVRLQAAL